MRGLNCYIENFCAGSKYYQFGNFPLLVLRMIHQYAKRFAYHP